MAGKSSAIPSSIESTIQKANGLQTDRSFDQALDAFGEAIQLIQEQRQIDKPLQASKAKCHSNMGQIFLQKKRWEEALSEFSHSAGIYELLQQPVEMGNALCGMSHACFGQKQWETALQHSHMALHVFQEAGASIEASKALAGLAEITFVQDNMEDCMQHLNAFCAGDCNVEDIKRATEVARKLEDPTMLIKLQQRQIAMFEEQLAGQAPSTETAEVSTNDATSDARLEALIQEKNEELRHFINKAAHDMKEPLRMISSFGTLLKGQYAEQLGEGGLEFLNFITDANERMSVLLKKLLEYVKVGTSEAAVSEVNLEDAVFLAQGDLKTEMEASGLQITTENLPSVEAQTEYIQLLFRHLIDNALKYNKADQPTLHISGELTGDAHVISFKDNGIGIDQAQHEKIFEIFIRLHSRSEYPGSGIGLAVAEKVMELYGGRISVESEIEKGATFRLHFPSN